MNAPSHWRECARCKRGEHERHSDASGCRCAGECYYHSAGSTACPRCGTDLAANEEDRCPRCAEVDAGLMGRSRGGPGPGIGNP